MPMVFGIVTTPSVAFCLSTCARLPHDAWSPSGIEIELTQTVFRQSQLDEEKKESQTFFTVAFIIYFYRSRFFYFRFDQMIG